MALKINDRGALVKKWQLFLKQQGLFTAEADGNFGQKTLDATKAFQQIHDIQATGVVGSLTLSKANSLGFNPESEPQLPQINSDQKMMQWIRDNLRDIINEATVGTVYSEDWLAGICARETGYLFCRFANQGMSFTQICPLMKDDFGKRPGETDKIYHGFGFWQIDIGSFPDFVTSEKWKDPVQTAKKAVAVLNGKMNFLKLAGRHNLLLPCGKEPLLQHTIAEREM